MVNSQITVLVLGVGGNVSQGILKALALSTLRCRIIGACTTPVAAGLFVVDAAYVSPLANDPAFLEWLITLCRTEKVDVILSGVEPVLNVLSPNAAMIRQATGAICVVSTPEQLAIGDDKLLTCQWLAANAFHYPGFADAQDGQAVSALARECGFPLIAKPRQGKAAYGIVEIGEERDLERVVGRAGYVVQEYLGDADHEYTAGCFSDCEGRVRGAIVMRRDLLQGTTYRAEVGEFPAPRFEAMRIAAALRPMGPCNIQMRMAGGKAVCFEINMRFSGTTPMRAHFGFNDTEAAIRHYVLGEPATDLPLITQGTALRYWNEIYVDDAAVATLRSAHHLDNPQAHPYRIEDSWIRSE